MNFHVFLPPFSSLQNNLAPVLYFLSGLTCTDENFVQKAGAFGALAKHGLALVACDTSPRGDDVPDDESAWDSGKGAGFYVDATQEPWSSHYKMYSYVVTELPLVLQELVEQKRAEFGVLDLSRAGIFGHSMGGHGALTIYLKNREKYQSVSAFAPISNPSHPECSWGQKNLGRYLGTEDKSAWAQYCAVDLVNQLNGQGSGIEIYVDQGMEDSFLKKGELRVDELKTACDKNGVKLVLNMREGYTHGYWFVQTFVQDHIEFHAQRLK